MRDITRSATAIGVGALCVLALSLPAAAAGPAGAVAPSDTTPATTEPAPPETTVPEDSTPDESTPDDTLVGAGNPDDDIDTTVAVIAIVGFVILLGVASWWMVRRSNPDAQPMPPPDGSPPSDLI